MKELPRINNIWYVEYIQNLVSDGVTPRDEVNDILDLIEGEDGFDKLRENLHTFDNAMMTGEPVKVGKRKTLSAQDFLCSFVCDPALELTQYERQFPIVETPIGDGRYRVSRDIPEEGRRVCQRLHWIYIELETIEYRLRNGADYAKNAVGEISPV